MPHNRTTYTPEPDGVFTVGQLIEILSKANKDAYIVVGRGLNDCDDHIERICIADNIVGFFTESADEYNVLLDQKKEEITMYNNYEITMDSFGDTCPTNWEEIAAHLNNRIETYISELTTVDEDGVEDIDEDELRRRVEKLWESYCSGDLDDAPAPVFED